MSIAEQKSIFFVSLPKSGTVYTWHSLCDMTGFKMPEFHLLEGWKDYNMGRDFSCPNLYACGDYNTQLLRPEQMKPFLKGFIFGAHMQASYHNIAVLEECGIDRIAVLLRDPRDAFVSWVHHLRQLGPSSRDYHSKIYHIPRAYYDWTLEQQFDFQVRSFFSTTVNWVEGWLDYYSSPNRRIDVLFVLYDELKRNPASYVRKILAFHGVVSFDASKVIVPELGKMHFRKGEHEQWRTDFSPTNQRLADDILQNRIVLGFDACARRHVGISTAETELGKGSLQTAAHAALSAIVQFPNFKYGYELLFQAAKGAGLNISTLREMVAQELASPTIGDCFIYRDELVDESASVVQKMHGA